MKKSAISSAKKADTLKRLADNGVHHSMIEFTCEHCGNVAKKLSYARNHGDMCKLSPLYQGPRTYKKKR